MVRIVTDSTTDLPKEIRSKVTVVPLVISFSGEQYVDGLDISKYEFYEKLIESTELPTTSQVTPYEFEEVFRKVLEEGDTAVCLTVSSKLSGTYQSAVIANDEVDNKIELVDSLNVTLGENILVRRAVELRDEGKTAKEIAEIINEEKSKVKLIALLDTLEYLKKGGRVSATAAFAGSVLSIKPVVGIVDGLIEVLGKARGSKNGNNKLMEQIEKVGGVDFTKPFSLGFTGLNDDLLQKYIHDSVHLYEGQVSEFPITTIGTSIGTHAGPGAIGVAFFAK